MDLNISKHFTMPNLTPHFFIIPLHHCTKYRMVRAIQMQCKLQGTASSIKNFKIIIKPTKHLSDFYYYQELAILNNIPYSSQQELIAPITATIYPSSCDTTLEDPGCKPGH